MMYSPSHDPWPGYEETTPVTDNSPSKSAGDRRRFLLISAAAITVMVGVLAWVILKYGHPALAEPKPTVRVTSCSTDGILTTLGYTITNNGGLTHDYYVEGTTGHSPTVPSILKNVAPGQTVSGSMVGGEQGDCQITRVDQR